MTWVIGMPTMFGYAVGIADIQVTWPDGRTLDCVQKIYPVGNFIGAGFCGSVKIGFALVRDLTISLNRRDPGGGGWIPRYVALRWFRRARRIFTDDFSAEEKKLGCAIMLLGASPRENLGDAPWARSDVMILDSRYGFSPQICARHQCASIGSGKNVKAYAEELARINRQPFDVMQIESGGPGGGGFALFAMLSMTLRENRTPGISEHAHMLRAFRGRVEVASLTHTDFSEEGIPTVHQMPNVAHDWFEFEQIASEHDRAAGAALA